MCFIKHKSKPLYRWDNPVLASSRYHMYKSSPVSTSIFKALHCYSEAKYRKNFMTQTSHIKVINKKVSTGQDFFFLMHNSYWFEIWQYRKEISCANKRVIYFDFQAGFIQLDWNWILKMNPLNTLEFSIIYSIHLILLKFV